MGIHLEKARGGRREASLGGVDIDLLGNGIRGFYFWPTNPPTKAEAWFPNDHMITGLTDHDNNYLGGSDNSY